MRLVGTNLSWFGVDEIDTAFDRNKSKIWAMWRLLVSRLRGQGPCKQGYLTSTPEGYGFLYDFFVKQLQEMQEAGKPLDRKMIKAATHDNPYLPDDYIPDLMAQYPPNLIQAYLYGEFVNLNTGTIYDSFKRALNNTNLTLSHKEFEKSPLHIGMDFNINKCAAIVHVMDDLGPIAIDEVCKIKNTEEMVKAIKTKYPNRMITIYPDSSGKSEKSNASQTDINILKAGGFNVVAPAKNPRVVDRINSMNAMFCNGEGHRRYRVNVERCPTYVRALEQQAYLESGEPDKLHDQDHPNDAAGYFVWAKYPIRSHAGKVDLVGV